MIELHERFFPRRQNPNGTFDSICLTCFKTVATVSMEEDLTEFDRQHVCDPCLVDTYKVLVGKKLSKPLIPCSNPVIQIAHT